MKSEHTSNRLLFVWPPLNPDAGGRKIKATFTGQFFIHQISVRSLMTASMCKEKTVVL